MLGNFPRNPLPGSPCWLGPAWGGVKVSQSFRKGRGSLTPMRGFLALALLLGLAWGQESLEALLVLKEEVIEGGELRTYTGLQRYPVASEAELKALLKKLSRPPSPPRFVFGEGGWRGVEKKGLLFDEKEALAAYREARASGRKSFRLPVRHIPPSLSLKDLYALGVREHLATGETDFRGSSRARAHNLLLASSRLDGLLIPPGPFSFSQALGPVTEEAGYQEAFVIVGDRTEQGLGGGVCQVSTTLFRAFFFAGLPILERHAHSYQVAYYRPPGAGRRRLPAPQGPEGPQRHPRAHPGPALRGGHQTPLPPLRHQGPGGPLRRPRHHRPQASSPAPGDPGPEPPPGGAQAGGLPRRGGPGGVAARGPLRGRQGPGGPGGERLPPLGRGLPGGA
jgi:hypothetical protein